MPIIKAKANFAKYQSVSMCAKLYPNQTCVSNSLVYQPFLEYSCLHD